MVYIDQYCVVEATWLFTSITSSEPSAMLNDEISQLDTPRLSRLNLGKGTYSSTLKYRTESPASRGLPSIPQSVVRYAHHAYQPTNRSPMVVATDRLTGFANGCVPDVQWEQTRQRIAVHLDQAVSTSRP